MAAAMGEATADKKGAMMAVAMDKKKVVEMDVMMVDTKGEEMAAAMEAKTAVEKAVRKDGKKGEK